MSVADFALADVLVRQIADHSSTVMVVAAAPDFRIIYANRAAYRAARTSEGDLIGRGVTEAFAFADAAVLASNSQGRAHARNVADRKGADTRWWDVSYLWLDAVPEEGLVLVNAVEVMKRNDFCYTIMRFNVSEDF